MKTGKFGRTATLVVAASNSTENDKMSADYLCDGTADDVEIQAALTAAAGGKVILLEGNYQITANLTVPSDTHFAGMGKGTILTTTAAVGITNMVILNGDNITVSDMKLVLGAGAGDAGSRPNVVYANTKTLIWLENLWLVGDKSVADDGSDVRQCGVCFVTVTESKIVDSRSEDNDKHSISLNVSSNNNTISGNTCQGGTRDGIYLNASLNNTITGNTCQGNAYGIYLNASLNNTITRNTCQATGDYGISLNVDSDNNTVTGNISQGNRQGILISGSYHNTVTGNTCQGNDQNGIYISGCSNNTVTGNTCRGNDHHGIFLDDSDNNTVTGNTLTENSQATTNTYDDISLIVADYNNIQGNTCRAGALPNKPKYGININHSTCDKNLVANNDLYDDGFGTAPFNDIGTLTHVEDNNRGISIDQIKHFRHMKNTSGVQRVAGDVVSLKAVAAGNGDRPGRYRRAPGLRHGGRNHCRYRLGACPG